MTPGLERWASRFALLVEIALVVGLAFLAARLIWVAFIPFSDVDAASGPGTVQMGQSVRARQDVLLTYDAFAHREVDETATPDVTVAEETRLNLVLTGINAGLRAGEFDPLAGSAIIQAPDGKQGSYRVGDEILRAVTLQSVHERYVVIENNGVPERLTLRDQESVLGLNLLRSDPQSGAQNGSSGSPTNQTSPTPASEEPANPESSRAPDPATPNATPDSEPTPREAGEPIRIAGPGDLLLNVEPSLSIDEDGREHLTLYPANDPAAFAALGLRPGDILERIDGETVSAAADVYVIAERLTKTSRFTVRVNRAGEEIEIDYWVIKE